MKHIFHTLALTLSITVGQAASADTYHPGLSTIAIKDENTARPLKGLVWYPADPQSPLSKQHSNSVWAGVQVANEAEAIAGTFPLVLLSHGMYGNARNQNWLATELVKKGYIAISLNHPGTSTWARDKDDARQMWERAKDISRTINFALNDPSLKSRIDPDRIFMAGHSLGGMTAMQLAGARYDPAQIEGVCQADPSELLCGLVELWQLGKTEKDRVDLAQNLRDQRIKAIAVFDLGGTQTFATESLNEIDMPLLVIGAPKNVGGGLNLDTESRALVAQLPDNMTTYLEPETMSHFDFLGMCTDKAIPILESANPGDGMICVDGMNERKRDHTYVISAVSAFFGAFD